MKSKGQEAEADFQIKGLSPCGRESDGKQTLHPPLEENGIQTSKTKAVAGYSCSMKTTLHQACLWVSMAQTETLQSNCTVLKKLHFLIYLKVRVREKETSSISWFTLEMAIQLGLVETKAKTQELHPGHPCG